VAEPGYGINIRRVFDAPPERVWAEWTTPDAFADWFGGPNSEVPLESVSMDVRPGGAWRLTMFAEPGRRQINWKGEYKEVDEPERLVFTVSDQPHDERHESSTAASRSNAPVRDGLPARAGARRTAP